MRPGRKGEEEEREKDSYGLNCVPPQLTWEPLFPNVTAFGDRAFRDVIKDE